MPALKKKGDAMVIQAHKDEPVEIKISGSGPATVALQKENSAPGSGSWRNLMSWSLHKGKNEDIESAYSEPHDELCSLRLVLKSAGEGTSVKASIEIPAEEKLEEKPILRKKVEGEFVESTREEPAPEDTLVPRSTIGKPAADQSGGATATARAPNAPLSKPVDTQTKK